MTVCFPIVFAIALASNNVAHCPSAEQVVETAPASPIEREIVAIAQRLINPLNQEIRSYCKRQLIPHNPSLQLTIDAAQATASAVVGGGRADLCCVGRWYLYDPYFVRHAAHEAGIDPHWPKQYLNVRKILG